METNNDEEKYIRTVNGIKKKSYYELKTNPDGKHNLCLPYEHICQNLGDLLIKNDQIKENETITLKNLSQITLYPFSSLKNLFLENDPTIIADELNNLKEFNCNLIVDASSWKNGQNIKVLREASKMSGIDICFGYTLKEDFYNLNDNIVIDDKLHNEIRFELTYGYDDMIPSFLGEFILSDNFPNANEQKLYRILIQLANEFSIPIFIKLNYNSFSNSFNIFEYFEKLINQIQPDPTRFNKKLLVFIYSNYECSQNDFDNIKQNILYKGFSLIFALYEFDLIKIRNHIVQTNSRREEIKNVNNPIILNKKQGDYLPITPYFIKNRLDFFVELLTIENKNFIKQIIVSNNLNFKIQLKNFGGFGYCNLFINYYTRIIEESDLNQEEIKYVFSQNLLNLLSWWSPPKKEDKKKKMVTCSNCKNQKEESDDIFRKFDHIFCSVKCLREFSKK